MWVSKGRNSGRRIWLWLLVVLSVLRGRSTLQFLFFYGVYGCFHHQRAGVMDRILSDRSDNGFWSCWGFWGSVVHSSFFCHGVYGCFQRQCTGCVWVMDRILADRSDHGFWSCWVFWGSSVHYNFCSFMEFMVVSPCNWQDVKTQELIMLSQCVTRFIIKKFSWFLVCFLCKVKLVLASNMFQHSTCLWFDAWCWWRGLVFRHCWLVCLIVQCTGEPLRHCWLVCLTAQRTGEPFILQPVASTVDRYSKIYLASKTPSAKIYYTLDGSRPSVNSKVSSDWFWIRHIQSAAIDCFWICHIQSAAIDCLWICHIQSAAIDWFWICHTPCQLQRVALGETQFAK